MKVNLPFDRSYLVLDCIPVHADFIKAADKLGMEVGRLAYLVCLNFGDNPAKWPQEVEWPQEVGAEDSGKEQL